MHAKRVKGMKFPTAPVKPQDTALLSKFMDRSFEVVSQKPPQPAGHSTKTILSTIKSDGFRCTVQLFRENDVRVQTSGGHEWVLENAAKRIKSAFLQGLPKWMFEYEFEMLVELIGLLRQRLEGGRLVPNESGREVGFGGVRTVEKMLECEGSAELVEVKIQVICIVSYIIPGAWPASPCCGFALPKALELEFFRMITQFMGPFVRDGWDTTYFLVGFKGSVSVYDFGTGRAMSELFKVASNTSPEEYPEEILARCVAGSAEELQAVVMKRVDDLGGEGLVLYSGGMSGGSNAYFKTHFKVQYNYARFCGCVKVKPELVVLANWKWTKYGRYEILYAGMKIGDAHEYQRNVGGLLEDVPTRFTGVAQDRRSFTGAKYLPFGDDRKLPYSEEYVRSVPRTIAGALEKNKYWPRVHEEQRKLQDLDAYCKDRGLYKTALANYNVRVELPVSRPPLAPVSRPPLAPAAIIVKPVPSLFAGDVFCLWPYGFAADEYRALLQDILRHAGEVYTPSELDSDALEKNCVTLVATSEHYADIANSNAFWRHLNYFGDEKRECEIVKIEWIRDSIAKGRKLDATLYKLEMVEVSDDYALKPARTEPTTRSEPPPVTQSRPVGWWRAYGDPAVTAAIEAFRPGAE